MRLKHLLFIALLVGAPIAFVAMRSEPLTPRQELDVLRASIESERPNEIHTLRKLERLTRDARATGDQALLADLLDVRATYLTSIGSADRARLDLEELLSDFRPNDGDLELRLAQTEVKAGAAQHALSRLNELVKAQPEHLKAWVEVGVLQQQQADERVTAALVKLRPLLVESDHTLVSGLFRKLAAQDPEDRQRTATIFAIRRFFRTSDEPELARSLTLADQASQEYAAARFAYATSFGLGLDRRAITGFLRMLIDAGEEDLALQTGLLGLKSPALRDNTETVELLIEVLLERGDYADAARVASLSLESSQTHSASHLRLLCLALYRGEVWSRLATAANLLSGIGRSEDIPVSRLYVAFVYSKGDRPRQAMSMLRSFATSQVKEPFPDARATAWFTIAQLARDINDAASEQEALLGGLAVQPNDHGAEWIRLADLQAETQYGGYRSPLESYSRGMSQASRFTSQLFDKWVELGEKVIAAGGRDITAIDSALRSSARIYPIGDTDPYLFYRLAELNLEAGRVASAATILSRLLDEYPGLLPAVDLRIRCFAAQKRRVEEVEWIVRRAELAGPDEQTAALLSGVSQTELSGEQRVRLMSMDPDNVGRLEVSRALITAKQDERALIALQSSTGVRKTESERLEEAHILFRLERFEEALNTYLIVDRAGPLGPDAVERLTLSATYVGKSRRVPSVLEELFVPPDRPIALRMLAGDLALRAGYPIEALAHYQLFEDKNAVDHVFLLKRAVAALIAADGTEATERIAFHRQAEAAIDRAEALSSSSEILVARLLLALAMRDTQLRDTTVRQVNAYSAKSSALQRTLAAVAAESWIEVRGILDGELSETSYASPDGAIIGLLSVIASQELESPGALPASFGRTGGLCLQFWNGTHQDPRENDDVAALLLASETPGFEVYALERLKSYTADRAGTLWPAFIAARVYSRLGEDSKASESANLLVDSHPEFLPGWTLLERIEAKRFGAGSQEVAALKRRRALSQDKSLARAEQALADAERKLANGNAAAAALQAESLIAAAPAWHEANALLARARDAEGRGLDAIDLWKKLCLESPPEIGVLYVDDFVEAIDRLRTRRREPLAMGTAVSMLDQLIEAFPRKPSAVLARAEADLDWDPANIAICVTRAMRRLDDYRESLAGRTLESVQPGSLAPWVQFYGRLDHAAAERVLIKERELAPGHPEAWLMLGRLYREQGAVFKSREALRLLARMLPDAATQLELAETSIALGMPHGAVARHLRDAEKLGAEKEGLEARVLAAASQLGQGRPASVTVAIEALDAIWQSKADIPRKELSRISSLYARALLSRADVEDKLKAIEVLQVGLNVSRNPYERAQLKALLGISRLENSALSE